LLSLELGAEFNILDLLFLVHFFFGLVHPLFFLEFLFATTAFDLHDELSSTVHGLQTTTTNVITLQTSFGFIFLALLLESIGFLFFSQVFLNSDISRVDFEDVVRVFENVLR